MYTLDITDRAKKDLVSLKKSGGKAVTNKIEKLLQELIKHRKTGTGQVEQLRGNMQGQWSRKIDKKNRLVYTINDEIVTVEVVSAKGITVINKKNSFLLLIGYLWIQFGYIHKPTTQAGKAVFFQKNHFLLDINF